jgi:hypothetical protein
MRLRDVSWERRLRGRPWRRGRALRLGLAAQRIYGEECQGVGRWRTHIHRRKNKLIASYSRNDGAVLAAQIDVLGQEAVPFRRCGTENGYSHVH